MVWSSLRWNADTAYRHYDEADLPHTLIELLIGHEPDKRLFRVEVLTALIIMITRLEDEAFKHHNTVPRYGPKRYGKDASTRVVPTLWSPGVGNPKDAVHKLCYA